MADIAELIKAIDIEIEELEDGSVELIMTFPEDQTEEEAEAIKTFVLEILGEVEGRNDQWIE